MSAHPALAGLVCGSATAVVVMVACAARAAWAITRQHHWNDLKKL